MSEEIDPLPALASTILEATPKSGPPMEHLAGRVVRRRRRRRSRLLLGGLAAFVALATSTVVIRSSEGPGRQTLAVQNEGGRVSVSSSRLPSGPPPTEPAATRAELHASLAERDLLETVELVSPDRVRVALALGRDSLADDLIRRYGDQVSVTVDGHQWPLTAGTAPQCWPRSLHTAPDTIRAVLTLDQSQASFAATVRGTVVVVNGSAEEVVLRWGGPTIDGFLRSGADGRLIGGPSSGFKTLDSTVVTVPSGERSAPLPVTIGVASCQPASGTAVQPGSYEAFASLDLGNFRLLSEPEPLTIATP